MPFRESVLFDYEKTCVMKVLHQLRSAFINVRLNKAYWL